ncbi:MAG TPA: hypothetical protein VEA59_03955 [Patescibacteria group bacterium]|nr:hypothetical protein [Patescibacteria group bacterium]
MKHQLSSTKTAVGTMNKQDGCPHRSRPAKTTTGCPVSEINVKQRKREYYFLLLAVLPEVMAVTRRLRERHPFGLVKHSRHADLISALDGELLEVFASAWLRGDYLIASYHAHDQIARTIEVATELWGATANWNSPVLSRLLELVDDHRQALFGKLAAQKRICSAMQQTLHISASLDRFGYNLFMLANKTNPSSKVMRSIHEESLVSAAQLTELHLERTRKIRHVAGAEVEPGGVVHRYVQMQYFYLNGHRVELRESELPAAMSEVDIDSADGRISCPGKQFVPEIWSWVTEVCDEFAYGILS